MFNLLKENREIADSRCPRPAGRRARRSISPRSTFAYEPDRAILHNLTFIAHRQHGRRGRPLERR